MDKLKVLGTVSTLVGLGATFLSSIINEKKYQKHIDESVNKAITEREMEKKKPQEVYEAEVVED